MVSKTSITHVLNISLKKMHSINQSINQFVLLRVNYIHTSNRKNPLSRTGVRTINVSSAATRETETLIIDTCVIQLRERGTHIPISIVLPVRF